MLHAAHAAAYHWAIVGTAINTARAELTLSRAYAVAGAGDRARHYADRFLRFCETNSVTDWELAFAYIAVAHGAALLGDAETHAHHYRAAATAVAAIAADGDRKVVEADLARAPAEPVALRPSVR